MSVLLLAVALAASPGHCDVGGARSTPNEILAEPIPANGALEFNPSLLPPGARGKFPSFDGDSFAVNIPWRNIAAATPRQTFDQIVAPLMRAMGFAARVESMRIPATGSTFEQLESGTLIEGALVIVGETSVHGTLFNRYRVANKVKLSPEAAASSAPRALAAANVGELVLLPYGAAAEGRVILRYAYRTLLAARDHGRSWLAWIDAESGCLLQLAPQFADAGFGDDA